MCHGGTVQFTVANGYVLCAGCILFAKLSVLCELWQEKIIRTVPPFNTHEPNPNLPKKMAGATCMYTARTAILVTI